MSAHTARAYAQELRRFFQFADTTNQSTQLQHIICYRNQLTENHPTTVAWKISVIRSFFSFLVQEQVIPFNPAQSIKSPRIKRHTNYPGFGESHFSRLINGSYDSSFKSLRNKCIFLCMGRLGMRVSEVCNLRLDSIDDNSDFPVLLIIGKGNAIRSVPILDGVSDQLDRYISKYPLPAIADYPLFPATQNKQRPLTTRSIQLILKRQCQRVGLSKAISPHTLRHFALSTLLKEGYDLFTIQNFAGHSQLATTARYLHNLKQQERLTMDIVRIKSLIGTLEAAV